MYDIVNSPKRNSKIFTIINILLFKSPINLYSLIILFIFTIVKKTKEFILLIPLLTLWLTAFVAPNTVYRYIFPSFVALPYLCYYIINWQVKMNKYHKY